MAEEELESFFPRLSGSGYEITSEKADRPNCIGWALYSKDVYFDPAGSVVGGYYWPPGIRRDDRIEAWAELFALHRYTPCDTVELEEDIEKVAIYAGPGGDASHVARQLESGEWTSKLNKLEDIRHATLDALIGDDFVEVARIMRRPRVKGNAAKDGPAG